MGRCLLLKRFGKQSGFTLIEVLVTFVVIALGLLGFGAMQVSTMNGSFETYQRALVTSMVEDMAARIRMNPRGAKAGEYFLSYPESESCNDLFGAPRDVCEWSEQLAGSSTQSGSDVDARNLGSPPGARGCISLLSERANAELWIRVSVAWLGMTPQTETSLECGLGEMGDEAYRRVAFRDVAVR